MDFMFGAFFERKRERTWISLWVICYFPAISCRKVTKGKPLMGKDGLKFVLCWFLRLCPTCKTNFWPIPFPLRTPNPCAPAERVRWRTFLSDCNWNRWCWFRWERTGCGWKGCRVCREMHLSVVRLVQWLSLQTPRGCLLPRKRRRQRLSFSANVILT